MPLRPLRLPLLPVCVLLSVRSVLSDRALLSVWPLFSVRSGGMLRSVQLVVRAVLVGRALLRTVRVLLRAARLLVCRVLSRPVCLLRALLVRTVRVRRRLLLFGRLPVDRNDSARAGQSRCADADAPLRLAAQARQSRVARAERGSRARRSGLNAGWQSAMRGPVTSSTSRPTTAARRCCSGPSRPARNLPPTAPAG
jgi:hypothetical protein